MPTGPDHYREAERLLGMAHHYTYGDGADPVTGAAIATEAQAHATLALAAATALAAPTAGEDNAGFVLDEWDAWEHAAAAPPVVEDDEDRGSIEDIYTAAELAEYDRDTEYRLDAEDDVRNTAEYEAEQRDGA